MIGPTASGKTEVAVYLAKKINAEIISCDSMLIYKGMDILTAKPHTDLLKKVKHHLLSIRPPTSEFNVAQYRRLALSKIKEIQKKGKTPLFTGGTGFYMNVMLDGIFSEKPSSRKVREELYRQAEVMGTASLYEKLKQIDHCAAEKIHPNDLRRIVRAIEVYLNTGRPISQLQKKRQGIWGRYPIKIFGLKRSKADLNKRIDKRVEDMFRVGLIQQVKRLSRLKLSRTAKCAIGIREIQDYLQGKYDLKEAERLMKRNTRLYAKRQMTWFKKDKRIQWIRVRKKDRPYQIAKKIWKKLS